MSNPLPHSDPFDLFAEWLVAHGWPCIEDMDTEDLILEAIPAYGRYEWSMEPVLPGLE